TWAQAGDLARPATNPSLVPLRDGRVLLVGWATPASPETARPLTQVFDPAAGTWSDTATVPPVMPAGNALRLEGPTCGADCGKVLSVGGRAPRWNEGEQSWNWWPQPVAHLYDPRSGAWDTVGPTTYAWDHRATLTLLADGRVLVVGLDIRDVGGQMGSRGAAEVYDPADRSWQPAAPPRHETSDVSATLLADGSVLVVGSDVPADAYRAATFHPSTPDPAHPGMVGHWVEERPTSWPRRNHEATILPDGRVLVSGGFRTGPDHGGSDPPEGPDVAPPNPGPANSSTELFDPVSRRWATGPTMSFIRADHTATLMACGVLAAGGVSGTIANEFDGRYQPTDLAEVWDLGLFKWLPTNRSRAPRAQHGAVLLGDGQVLVAGGEAGSPPTSEVYEPACLGPLVTGVIPNAGPLGGGTRVTVLGAGFAKATRVSFGSRSVTAQPCPLVRQASDPPCFTVDAPDVITVYNPAGERPGTVHVRVSTALGTSPEMATDRFEYLPGEVPVLTLPTTPTVPSPPGPPGPSAPGDPPAGPVPPPAGPG
ncbi:MAG: IPT/TIG domain-containing protein, partial [Acidimicrobiales bacterium]